MMKVAKIRRSSVEDVVDNIVERSGSSYQGWKEPNT
jgi:hypothetical protein